MKEANAKKTTFYKLVKVHEHSKQEETRQNNLYLS